MSQVLSAGQMIEDMDSDGKSFYVTLSDCETACTFHLRKYSRVGRILWEREAGEDFSGIEVFADLVVDRFGNSYVIGSLFNDTESKYSSYLKKFDPNGVLLWKNTLNGGVNDSYLSEEHLAVDQYGNVVTATFEYATDGTENFLINKYDSTGERLQALIYSGRGPSARIKEIKISDDALYLLYANNLSDQEPNNSLNMAKFSVDGTFLWDRIVSASTFENQLYSHLSGRFAFDRSSQLNIVTDRRTVSNSFTEPPITTTNISQFDNDATSRLWERLVYSPIAFGNVSNAHIGIDKQNNIYIVGIETIDPEIGANYTVLNVSKFDISGKSIWAKRFTLEESDYGFTRVTGFFLGDAIYVTGSYNLFPYLPFFAKINKQSGRLSFIDKANP